MTMHILTGGMVCLPEATTLYRFTRALLRFLSRRLFRVEITGLEKLPAGNYVLAANHLRWIDPFLILLFFPLPPRIYWMAASELTAGIWWRRLVTESLGGVIPVDRSQKSASRALVEACIRVLDSGGVLGVFPEGGEGKIEGQLRGRLKRGAVMFARKTGKPIVPVGISGTRELFLGKRLRINIGEPIFVQGLEDEAVMGAMIEGLQAAILPIHPNQPTKKRLRNTLTYLLDDPDDDELPG